MTKPDLKERAVKLRRDGYSYNLIREQVPVSKSTLTAWLSDVPYTPNEEVRNRIRGAILSANCWKQNRKRESLEKAATAARRELRIVSKRDLLMLGIGLYIGEGSKSQGHVRIINSDPQVLCLAILWFEDVLGLSKENFSPIIHLYPDNDVEESIAFWSRVTGIPRIQFGKTQIDRREKKLKKRGMLKHGTAHLYIRSNGHEEFGMFLFRKIIALIDEVYRQTN